MGGRFYAAALTLALAGTSNAAVAQATSSETGSNQWLEVFQHQPGADDAPASRPGEVQASQHHMFVPAAAFVRRNSTQSLNSPSPGCTSSVGTLQADLQLPAGAVILGVRTYSYNLGESTAVRTWLTSYNGAGAYTDHIGEDSTDSSGYSSRYFAADPPVTVDPTGLAYALNARLAPNLRLCGMRVFYEYQ